MARVLVIADDLTGANDTGALLKKLGLRSITAISSVIDERWYRNADVLSLNTNSRAMAPEKAYRAVNEAAKRYAKDTILVSKRIDTTLRGNIGSEVDGVLDAMSEGYKAVVVVAYPQAGRVCIDGHVLVDGMPVEEYASVDIAGERIPGSCVEDVIRMQSSRSVMGVKTSDIEKGDAYLSVMIGSSPADIIVCDAASDEHINRIASICVQILPLFICIDPGPFTFAVSKIKCSKENKGTPKIILAVGSMADISRKQFDCFIHSNSSLVYTIDSELACTDTNSECEKGKRFFRESGSSYPYLCITTTRDYHVKAACAGSEKNQSIALTLTHIIRDLIQHFTVSLVYVCGGDIACNFLQGIEACGIDIIEEVIPLAVYGKILGGPFHGLSVLTKGGIVGDENAISGMLKNIALCNSHSKRMEEET